VDIYGNYFEKGYLTPDVQFSDCCFSLDVRLSVVFVFVFVLVLVLSFPFIFPSDQRSIVQPPCSQSTILSKLQDVPSHMYESQSYNLLRME